MGSFLEQTRNRLWVGFLQVISYTASIKTFELLMQRLEFPLRGLKKGMKVETGETVITLSHLKRTTQDRRQAIQVDCFLRPSERCLEKQILLQTGDIEVEKTRISLNQHMNTSDQEV